MARHAQENKKGKADKNRLKNMALFEELTPKAVKYIKECQDAVLPCTYCAKVSAEGGYAAPKLDELGNCLKCHGTKVLPDHELRKWANEEVVSRTAPKPKSVEMEVDDKREIAEMQEMAEALGDDEVEKLAKQLGVVFGDETGLTEISPTEKPDTEGTV